MATQAVGAFINMVAYPIIFEKFVDNIKADQFKKGIKSIVLLFFVVTVALASLNYVFYWKSGFIISLIFAAKYYAVAEFMWKLFLGQSLIQIVMVVFLLTGQALRETSGYTIIRFLSTAVHLALGIVWTREIGIYGMANASLVGSLLNFAFAGCLTFYLVMKKLNHIKAKDETIGATPFQTYTKVDLVGDHLEDQH